MLIDVLENAMKGTPQEGEFQRLFYGQRESVIKCNNVDFESISKETFSQIQVHLLESNSIENAIRELFKAEDLTLKNEN